MRATWRGFEDVVGLEREDGDERQEERERP